MEIEYLVLLVATVLGMSLVGIQIQSRIGMKILKSKQRQIQFEQILGQFGRNFKIADLDKLSEQGFQRLIQFVLVLKQPVQGVGGMNFEEAIKERILQGLIGSGVQPQTAGGDSVGTPKNE